MRAEEIYAAICPRCGHEFETPAAGADAVGVITCCGATYSVEWSAGRNNISREVGKRAAA